MKQKFLLKTMLLLSALIAGSGSVWGQSTATLQITSSVTSQGNLTDNSSNTWAFTTDGTLTGNNSYIQAGTNKSEVSYIRLTTSAFSTKKITKVQVWGTSKANTNVSAKVIIGTTTIGTSSVYTSQNASSGGTEFSVNNTNEVIGDLTIEISRASSATGAIYFNKAIVTYEETGGGDTPTSCNPPSFDPVAGTYTSTQSVELSTTTEGATIYYTMGDNPADPTTSSDVYSSPISVSSTTTIKAIAVKDGLTNSSVSSATYTIKCNAPTFQPAAGTYTSAQSVTLSTETAGASIYYTTDGSTPTTSSTLYSSAIYVSETQTIKAIAVKEGLSNSDVATAAYTITLPYSGPGYVRVNSLDYLTANAKVIIAARYNSTATSYYAMTAAASGKPTGVSFSSTTTSNGEELPASIVDSESTYYWTVGVTEEGTGDNKKVYYTFTNANATPQTLGYSSSTNFATGGDNTEWVVSIETAGNSAMVSGYEGFYIYNKNTTARGIALNSNHNFGPYDKGANNNSNSYNFYLDIFVEGATPNSNPSLAAENVNIAYNGTSGSISYTLNNSKTGGEVTAAITAGNTGNWLSIGNPSNSNASGTVALTCAANDGAERTATVTLTYTYDTDKTVTKDVTVTQAGDPDYVPTISEVRAQGTGSVHTVGIVTSVNAKTAYIQDSGAAIAVYDSSADLNVSVGDEIEVTGTLGTYNGLLQIQSPTISVLSSSNSVTPEVMTIAQVNASTKQGWLVTIEDATVSTISNLNVTIAQSTNTIVVRFNNANDITFEANDVITLTGNIGNYNAVQIANPTDISVAVNTTPSISLSSYSIEATTATISGSLTVTCANIDTSMGVEVHWFTDETGNTRTNEKPDWIDTEITTTTLSYEIAANTSDARTAYFKVYGLDEGANDVYSDLVTISQAAYVSSTTYTLATSITPGKHYVIASGTSGNVKVMSVLQNANNRSTASGSVSGTTLSVNANVGIAEMIIYGPDASGNYTIYNVRYKDKDNNWVDGGYLYAASSSSNYLRTQETNDMNGKWSISIDSETKAATVVAQGSNTNKYLRFNNTLFSCYASNSSVKNPVYLYEKADAAVATTVSKTLNGSGYATFATTSALDFLDADAENVGYSAWQITEINKTEGTITFSQIKNHVKAGTGILLKGTSGASVNLNILPVGGSTLGDNLLVGTTEDFVVNNDGDYYGLSGNTFVKVKAGTVSAGKALLPKSVVEGSDVKAFRFVFDDEDDPTSIEGIDNEQQTTEGSIYNLAGQRLQKMQKGINIVNGKKVLF